MRKIGKALLLALLMLFAASTSTYAANTIIEVPKVKFIINNQITALTDVPLNVGGRTLLPLKAALVSLGVPDDDEHIRWNGKEQSVTVIKDDTKVYLKVGSKTAYINDVPVEMDVAPFLYNKNQRTYIPVKFVSTAVGKEVAWDGTTSSVYIRDKDQYNAMKATLDKVDAAMDSIRKVKIETSMKLNISAKGTEVNLDVTNREELDKTAKVLYSNVEMPLFGNIMSFMSYIANNAQFDRDVISSKWKKTVLTESSFEKLLTEDVSLETINYLDVLSASMVEEVGPNPGELLLKGNVYPKGLAASISKNSGIGRIEPDKYYLEAVVDSDTNLVKRLYVEIDGKYSEPEGYSTVKAVISVIYSDINGDFNVLVPEGLDIS